MSSNVVVSKAFCGCSSVLFHGQSCKVVHGDAAKIIADPDRVFVDVEDGSVWLHAGGCVTRLSAERARTLGDELHVCAQELKRG